MFNKDEINSNKTGRLGIFIDEANLYYSQKTLGWKIGYEELKNYLSVGTASQLRIYIATVKNGLSQTNLLNKLKNLDFTIISKNLKLIKALNRDLISKGNLDIELALDAYILKDSFDTFVLFSGDSDFAYLVDLLKKEGKKIITFSTKEHISRELITRSDLYVDLRKLRSELEYLTSDV